MTNYIWFYVASFSLSSWVITISNAIHRVHFLRDFLLAAPSDAALVLKWDAWDASFMTFGLENSFWSSLEDVSSSSGRVKSCSIFKKEDVKLLRQEILSNIEQSKHPFPNLPILLCPGNMASWQSSPPSCLSTRTVCWTFAPTDEKSVEVFGDCGDPWRISFWTVFRCQEMCSWN